MKLKDKLKSLKNEKILIFGDYDVDGITATALLTRFFERLGLETPEPDLVEWERMVHAVLNPTDTVRIAIVVAVAAMAGAIAGLAPGRSSTEKAVGPTPLAQHPANGPQFVNVLRPGIFNTELCPVPRIPREVFFCRMGF